MKKRVIYTNNREIYEKFNMLNFSNEVVLKTVKPIQIERIVNNINKKENVLQFERIGDYYLVKRIGVPNYNIYFRC